MRFRDSETARRLRFLSTRVAESTATPQAKLALASLGEVRRDCQPRVDPVSLEIGIVHLGLGAFHRAHEEIYTEDAMASSGDHSWAVCGVSPRGSSSMSALQKQDGLYTVLEREHSVAARVVGSLRSVLSARSERTAVIDQLARASTRIVSFTVTEAGYLNPSAVVELLCHGIAERRRVGGGPITALCCDNIPRNGEFLRSRILDAAVNDPPLTRWIEQNVSFPSGVVDRLVPTPMISDMIDAADAIGVRDYCAVSCESFSQWIIQDDFIGGRPPWELAGVIFTASVEPYELAKLRILNGAHSALAYLGVLKNHELIANVLEDDLATEFTTRLLRDEVVPTLTPPPDVDLNEYSLNVLSRFRNRALNHHCAQVASDGSQKLPIRVLPSLCANLASGRPVHLASLVVAAWMHYISKRRNDEGTPLVVVDPYAERLARLLHNADTPETVVDVLLSVDEIFNAELSSNRLLRDELVEWVGLFSTGGTQLALSRALHAKD